LADLRTYLNEHNGAEASAQEMPAFDQ